MEQPDKKEDLAKRYDKCLADLQVIRERIAKLKNIAEANGKKNIRKV